MTEASLVETLADGDPSSAMMRNPSPDSSLIRRDEIGTVMRESGSDATSPRDQRNRESLEETTPLAASWRGPRTLNRGLAFLREVRPKDLRH